MGQPNRSNHGWPSWGWKPRRHAVHWVADQVVRSTTRKTVRICPQRIFVADMRALHRKLLKENGGNEVYYKSLCARIVESRSEEHTSEIRSLMRISYAVFCLKKKNEVIKHLIILTERQ